MESEVEFAIQVISSHPLVSRAVEKILSHAKDFPAHVLLPASRMVAATGPLDSPRLFLLDGCSLPMDLGPLAVRCRVHSPGSKVLALLPPGDNVRAEEARLFSWGLDGFVELHETWQSELPRAILSILNGQLWVPPEVLLAFVKQAKTLLESQLLHGHFLTAREAQILQLLMRRSTNKEISSALSISERTVKFHVSNILSKLHMDDRRGLSADKFVLNILTSES
jgi:DNA-binding NarL/FixJ family response regulator